MNTNLPKSPDVVEILLYQTEDGQTRLEVRLQDDTVWLTQKRMAELFQKDVRTINEHIKNIFEEGELKPESVIRKFRITAEDGKGYETIAFVSDQVSDHQTDQVIVLIGLPQKLQRVASDTLTPVSQHYISAKDA